MQKISTPYKIFSIVKLRIWAVWVHIDRLFYLSLLLPLLFENPKGEHLEAEPSAPLNTSSLIVYFSKLWHNTFHFKGKILCFIVLCQELNYSKAHLAFSFKFFQNWPFSFVWWPIPCYFSASDEHSLLFKFLLFIFFPKRVRCFPSNSVAKTKFQFHKCKFSINSKDILRNRC